MKKRHSENRIVSRLNYTPWEMRGPNWSGESCLDDRLVVFVFMFILFPSCLSAEYCSSVFLSSLLSCWLLLGLLQDSF
jgi:hypothetical protein